VSCEFLLHLFDSFDLWLINRLIRFILIFRSYIVALIGLRNTESICLLLLFRGISVLLDTLHDLEVFHAPSKYIKVVMEFTLGCQFPLNMRYLLAIMVRGPEAVAEVLSMLIAFYCPWLQWPLNFTFHLWFLSRFLKNLSVILHLPTCFFPNTTFICFITKKDCLNLISMHHLTLR
jgi:hypothetical protein